MQGRATGLLYTSGKGWQLVIEADDMHIKILHEVLHVAQCADPDTAASTVPAKFSNKKK